MSDKGVLCPSAPCVEGAAVIGVVDDRGRVEMLEAAVPVAPALVELARTRDDLGKRLRLSFPCRQGGCAQWEDGGCGISRKAAAVGQDAAPSTALPPCPIRARCRWFSQDGPQACRVCPEILTDQRA